MTQDILRNLARAKATFQARTLETILTEGKPMTQEHTANEEARHGNRDALEAMTRERDRLREALETVKAQAQATPSQPFCAMIIMTVDAALEDTK